MLAKYAEETLGEYECGFRADRSTIDHIFAMRQTQEKAYEHNIHLHNLFIDFKQAFDSVNRGRMLNDFLILGIPRKLVHLINVTMAGPKVTVRVDNQYTLSSVLFDLVLEAILQKMHITGLFISNLSDDRSTASSKTIPPLNAI
jgi:hypothetical protein